MKIGIIHNSLNWYGGAEKVCLNIIRSLKEEDHEVTLITFDKTDWNKVKRMDEISYFPDHEKYLTHLDNFKYFTIYKKHFIVFLSHKKEHDIMINTHGDLLPIKSDLVYCHFPTMATLEQDEDSKYLKNPFWKLYYIPYKFLNWFNLKSFTRGGWFLTNSSFSKRAIKEYFNVDSHIIYPPIRLKDFDYTGWESKENIVVSCGRFSKEKNHEFLLEVSKKMKDIEFYIVGGCHDPESEKYFDELLTNKLEEKLDNFHLLKNLSHRLMIHLYKKAKIYFHSMIDEHFGISIVEGMGMGLTPIVHKSGGAYFDVIARGKFGLYYSDLDEAIEKIREALELSKDFRYTVNERSKEFGEERFRSSFMKVFNRYVEKRGL